MKFGYIVAGVIITIAIVLMLMGCASGSIIAVQDGGVRMPGNIAQKIVLCEPWEWCVARLE